MTKNNNKDQNYEGVKHKTIQELTNKEIFEDLEYYINRT